MDKSTLSNYGWIVAVVVVLAIMISLATPFGSVIRSNVESQVTKLQGTASGALDAAGGASSFDDLSGGGSGGGAGGSGGTGSNLIPAGAVYTVAATSAVLTGDNGDSFPEAPATGDTYEEGDYIYKYNQYYKDSLDGWQNDANQNGWGVRVKDMGKVSYGEILPNIDSKPVTTLRNTFRGCDSLVSSPSIPGSVTNMSCTFSGCESLESAPTIPNGVTNMSWTFDACISLADTPEIPATVTDISYAFCGCISMGSAPVIPNGVTNMAFAFWECSFTSAPDIPSSVTNMEGAFVDCIDLEGAIKIDANPSSYDMCLSGTQITEVTGSTALKAEILATVSE